ncbi:argininosuccinate synthase [Campylobacter fetus]|uniref:argininosuccinate synthase domain-containing protein n=1 Tax=Campylobacter fetus TaxID=196 RepID=UPI0008187884|nr:argininosuccinate synthase domain-containing protein [Campylobacter fetus]EAH8299959.1 ATP-binding protein [Campylobacter fetus]EAI7232609.1 ATP-binding protein [Campylobacter fetus]EAJ5689533.1 ATP-binding protein [Campylobacter fetus]EAK0427810.1 ATP-binding protein [Campylobacter fetus]EAK5305201.1 ATP-binding protein [Campylobacter fetus]
MNKKCLALFSGGLDSMLAIKLISSQGIEVHALNIDIGFGGNPDKAELMSRRAKMAGATFEVINARSKYLQEVLFNPKFGYGKQFNPCIDCHGFMFRTAISMLEDYGASFVISGEVVGQRPMSQRNDAMVHVKNLALDDNDIILRPLCAKLLKPTRPEREGLVDRELLLDFNGRGRSRQLELAHKFGFSDFETPGGGCLYTMEGFSNRIRDFIKFDKNMSEDDLQSLRYGRHLRLLGGAKMIIGRDEKDNAYLEALNLKKMESIKFDDIIGAHSFISKNASKEDLEFGARLAITYCKSEKDKIYRAKIGDKTLNVSPFDNKNIAQTYFIK